MSPYCKWAAFGNSWKCDQCAATIARNEQTDAPLSVCPAAAKQAGVSFAEHQRIVSSRPGYVSPMVPPADVSAGPGPGTELKKLLSKIGIVASPGCSCNSRAAMMNQWGADVCEQRIDEIVAWLREEAVKRGLPFVELAARILIKKAIANARAAEKPIDPP